MKINLRTWLALMLLIVVPVSAVTVIAVRSSDKAMKIAYGKGVQAAETRIAAGECNLQIKRGKFILAKGTKFEDGLPVAWDGCSEDAVALWNEGMGWQKSKQKCDEPGVLCVDGVLADPRRRSVAMGGHKGGPLPSPWGTFTIPARECTVVSFDRGCEEWHPEANHE